MPKSMIKPTFVTFEKHLAKTKIATFLHIVIFIAIFFQVQKSIVNLKFIKLLFSLFVKRINMFIVLNDNFLLNKEK